MMKRMFPALAFLLLVSTAYAIEGTAKVDSKLEDLNGLAITLEVSKAQFDSVKLGETITFNKPTTPPVDPEPPVPPTGLDPAKAPGQNFNLTNWKLTLPISSSGALSGTSAEVKPLPATYKKAPWFVTGGDGAMVFTCPVAGAKTSLGTSYVRCELRELAGGTEAAWKVAQGGTLKGTLAVNEMPKKTGGGVKDDFGRLCGARIIVGQIHGPDDELCRLYYEDGGLMYYINDLSQVDDADANNKTVEEHLHYLVNVSKQRSAIPLNSQFAYTIVVANGNLTVTVQHASGSFGYTEKIASKWTGQDCYFKSGLYQGVGVGSAGTTGTGQGKVSFYSLPPASHP